MQGVKRVLIGLAGISVGVYADLPSAIIGGEDNGSNAYGAFVSYPSGTVTPITGLPTASSQILSVAINESGVSLVGGDNGNTSPETYAVFVSPSGALTTLDLSGALITGSLGIVTINQSGQGLIGTDNGYAAFIAADGTVTSFGSSGINEIVTVALNDSGIGLIGGEGVPDAFLPYAAYVDSTGPTQVLSTPEYNGFILSVAVNDLGNGIIGGWDTNDGGYAGLVSSGSADVTVITPSVGLEAQINSVAINNSGAGIIGGNDGANNAYAALVTSEGDATPFLGSSFSGTITSVALNSSGTGLIGGQDGSSPYAALVQPDGSVTSLLSIELSGQINWVSINDAGVGLIGGQASSIGYAALVAPNGALTVLDLSNISTINSVSISKTALTNAATPKSTGPYLGAFYTQLAASAALESRFVSQNRIWAQSRNHDLALASNPETNLASNEMNFSLAPRKSNPSCEQPQSLSCEPNSFWIAPFGNYVSLQNQGTVPNYTNEIGGILAAYDRRGSNYLVGATLGYAFDYLDYSQGLGHGKLQEELACLYGAYYSNHFTLNAALWGGLYQTTNIRHTLSLATSRAKIHGWLLSPHLEMGSSWAIDQQQRYFVEPFIMFDWVNSWQSHFTEEGSSGLNLQMGSLYGSLLQSEVGLRFYERFAYGWGDFCLEEKLSYINQSPFHLNSATTAFVASASTFPIAVGSTKIENLGSIELIGSFVPSNSYLFGGFAVQVSAGSSYQSYYGSLFGGIDF